MDEINLSSWQHEINSNGINIKYYVPEKINEETKVFYYLGGSGGSEQWDTYTSPYLENNPDTNAIVVCVENPSHYSSSDVNQNINNFIKKCDIAL